MLTPKNTRDAPGQDGLGAVRDHDQRQLAAAADDSEPLERLAQEPARPLLGRVRR